MPVKKKKTVWKTIKVPAHVHKALKSKATSGKVAMHKIISSALIVAEDKDLVEVGEKVSKIAKDIDRVVWYAFKLSNSVAMFKRTVNVLDDAILKDSSGSDLAISNKINSELQRTIRTVEQIESRLDLDLTEVKDAIYNFIEERDGKATRDLNDAVKKAMVKIINKVVE